MTAGVPEIKQMITVKVAKEILDDTGYSCTYKIDALTLFKEYLDKNSDIFMKNKYDGHYLTIYRDVLYEIIFVAVEKTDDNANSLHYLSSIYNDSKEVKFSRKTIEAFLIPLLYTANEEYFAYIGLYKNAKFRKCFENVLTVYVKDSREVGKRTYKLDDDVACKVMSSLDVADTRHDNKKIVYYQMVWRGFNQRIVVVYRYLDESKKNYAQIQDNLNHADTLLVILDDSESYDKQKKEVDIICSQYYTSPDGISDALREIFDKHFCRQRNNYFADLKLDNQLNILRMNSKSNEGLLQIISQRRVYQLHQLIVDQNERLLKSLIHLQSSDRNITNLNKQLEIEQVEKEKLMDDLKSLKEKEADLVTQNTDLLSRLETAKHAAANLCTLIDEDRAKRQREITDLTTQLQERNEQLSNAEKDIAALNDDLAKCKDDNAKLSESVKSLSDKLNNIKELAQLSRVLQPQS